MWRLGRFLARRSSGSAWGGADALRSYGRWLNEALAQLAEALLWATPLATSGLSCGDRPNSNQQARVRDTRRHLEGLLDGARQHLPPAGMDPSLEEVVTHQEFVMVAERCLAALDALAQGLATADEGTVRVASAQLCELATAASDLHGRVIAWTLPLLLGAD